MGPSKILSRNNRIIPIEFFLLRLSETLKSINKNKEKWSSDPPAWRKWGRNIIYSLYLPWFAYITRTGQRADIIKTIILLLFCMLYKLYNSLFDFFVNVVNVVIVYILDLYLYTRVGFLFNILVTYILRLIF